MHATRYAQDPLVHFDHLHALDWVDVVSALKADPRKTAELAPRISNWPNSSFGYLREVQNKLKTFVDGGLLGIFVNGYWCSAAYKLPPEANLMAVAHDLEALNFQKEIVKIQTVFGGKNPHPNWLVGGVPCSLNVNDAGAIGAINMFYLNMAGSIIDRTIDFIDNVYLPDLLAVASFYQDWAKWGGGLSGQNALAYGDFPDIPGDYSNKSMLLPMGVILNGNLKEVMDVDLKAPDQVQEWVTHSWYKYSDETKGLHPWDGVTEPNVDIGKTKGTKTRLEAVDESAKYSWIKAPHWKGHAVEVGPPARYVIGYARGSAENKEQVDAVLKKLDVPITALFATLGRTAARGLEASWAAHKMFTLGTIVLIVTGLGLYAQSYGWGSTWMNLFGWVTVGLGSPQAVRTAHHLAMWSVLIFALVHVYRVFRDDVVGAASVVGTMVNGIRMWKGDPRKG